MANLDDGLAIKGLSMKNRIVLPPLTTNYGSKEGFVTEKVINFYKARSKDVGLVVVEATAVQANGRIVPRGLGLWNDFQIASMSELVKTIKEQGAATIVQINHAGSRCVPLDDGIYGFSPSGIAFRDDVVPIVMQPADIEQLITDFTIAANRAIDAGFDGVEIHGAHLYLLSQFLSPLTNKREDRYGGDARGRATLALEIVKSIRERIGSDLPLFFRLNAVERIEGGQPLEDALVIATLLAEAGVDVFDVSLIAYGGFKETGDKCLLAGSSALPKDQPYGANIELAASFKKNIGLPVITVGKLGCGPEAREALQMQKVDMVAIGRQMICDPETAEKILHERYDQVIPCKECLKCFTTIGRGDPMACKVNKNLPF